MDQLSIMMLTESDQKKLPLQEIPLSDSVIEFF